jgi:peptide methionine sulfoxide reductase MsrA
MSQQKKPKWLKKLKRLMKSSEEKDRAALETVLTKLKVKATELEQKAEFADTEEDKQTYLEKRDRILKHLKKGESKLKDDDSPKGD